MSRRRCGLPLLALSLLCACAPTPTPPAPLAAVPLPDLAALEPALAARLRQLHADAETLRARADSDPAHRLAAFATLGKTLAAFDFLEAATAALANAEKLAPKDPAWPHLLGVVAYERGDLAAAEKRFERVLELAGDDWPVLVHLATVRLQLGRPAAARAPLERARAMAPEEAVVHDRLGKLAAAEGDDRAAIAHFERALALDPEASAVRYALGQAHRRLGELAAAQQALAGGGEREVRWHDPVLAELGDRRNLVSFEVIAARVEAPAEFDADDTLDFALSAFGNVAGSAEGMSRYLSELEQRPGGVEPRAGARWRFLIGGLLVQQNRDVEAIEAFRTAVALAPDFLEARFLLANALARTGQAEAAVGEYGAILERDPRHVAARLRRGALELNLGRTAEGLADLEQAVMLAPGDPEAHAMLERARRALR